MTPLENDLARTFREHHRDAEVPLAPTAELVQLGRSAVRRRRRRTALVAAAVLVPVLVVTPWALISGGKGEDPTTPTRTPSSPASPSPTASATLADLPLGAAPTIPYLAGHALHLGDIAIPTTADNLLTRGRTLLVQKHGGATPTWWRLEGDHLVPEPALKGVFNADLSPDGTVLAWVDLTHAGTPANSSTTTVVAWNPVARKEIKRIALPFPETCCDGGSVQVIGIDSSDRVYWIDPQGNKVWDPHGGEPHPVTGINTEEFQIAPTGPIGESVSGGAEAGTVDATGHWTATGDLPATDSMIWDQNGTAMVYDGEALTTDYPRRMTPAAWVYDLTARKQVQLAIPPAQKILLLGVQGGSNVYVEAKDSTGSYVLRCDGASGACVRTVMPDTKGHWTFDPWVS